MQEILSNLQQWQARGDETALATVTWTAGSTPRTIGAKMAINSRGEFVGSVSGGCVEGAVIDEARQVIRTGRPKLVSYGISDDMAWDVGLACGGSIRVFIEKVQS
ncbi:MAG: XdhC family protein [Anaerolineae bacterium]|nr:XdhC family protein [Anaerolineae bacterium]